ncbi:MAG: DNA polymerase III psi subunit [Paraglaciecola sp.]|jgi:DNA polymerase III psi subunit
MESTSNLVLSDYQRAILNEMGIALWQLASEDATQVKFVNQPLENVSISSDVISKTDALAKLKQLKLQTQKFESTDSILMTFSTSDTQLQMFTDILIALGLEAKSQKHISTEQLNHYSGYPLSWTLGEKVSMNSKQLITPALGELNHPEIKKQLWQQLKCALSLQNPIK